MTDSNTVDYDPRRAPLPERVTTRELGPIDGVYYAFVAVEASTLDANGDLLLTLRMRPK